MKVREIADRAGSIGVSAFAQRAHRPPLCSESFSDERFVDANAASTTSTHEITSCSFSFITLLLLCRCPRSGSASRPYIHRKIRPPKGRV